MPCFDVAINNKSDRKSGKFNFNVPGCLIDFEYIILVACPIVENYLVINGFQTWSEM